MTIAGDATDVLVVGGGQAGLATGYHLKQLGIDFLILDAEDEVGAIWRSRWDSLVLFTAARYDSLPGMSFPAPPDTYPTKDDVASYLRDYAARFELPVRLGQRVASLRRHGDGFVAETPSGVLRSRSVIVATGPFQRPRVPDAARGVDPSVTQLHSAGYRSPSALPPGPVLVVGGANSGCQIAHELATTREVELAMGKRQPVLPQRLLGKDIWWWGEKLGVSRITIESRLGRRLSGRDPVIGMGPRTLARRFGVRLIAFEPESTQVDGVLFDPNG